ncbi:Na(+)/glucose symporter [Limihaloglobus sulfuriphilus]|uniref:Na(+)/glucose symporter n=1 Tax=Limihaloglobus sulfuriphilus TaxID=1851148 RepID=A0A1Q2MI31_9BACT|nr:sodium/solute symporter [Limihaloglobus sulfuriphilus]AQQ72340.1 Na(+)/glucose symporter [Limihaloglobus sulfuriphilus]
MQEFGLLNITILIVYMSIMMLLGLWFSRGRDTAEDYFLAGRSMPWLVVGMSMFASLTSAVTYIGVPAIAYYDNVSIFFGVMASLLVAPLLTRVFYSIYLRENVTTSYQYIASRFGPGARYCVSALFVLTRLGWLGNVIFAPSLALSAATGIHLSWCIIIIGFLATVYTVLGGLKAVLWTDVFQFVLLAGGAVFIVFKLAADVEGGFAGILAQAAENAKLDVLDFRIDLFKMTAAIALFSYLLSFMQDYGVDQVTVQRLISVGSIRGIKKAVYFNAFTDIIINAVLLFIGLGLFAFFKTTALPEDVQGSAILPHYIVNYLPAGISGLIVTAIFAAAMSSLDSGINSVSTVIVNDFIVPLKKGVSEHQKVAIGRLLTFVLGIIAIISAFYAGRIGDIVKVTSSFLGMFSAPVLVLFLAGILSRKCTFLHWVPGLAVSLCVSFYLQQFTQVHWIYYFPAGFISCFGVTVLGLLFFAKNNNAQA